MDCRCGSWWNDNEGCVYQCGWKDYSKMGNPTDNSAEGKFITINIANTIDQKLDELHTTKEKLIGLGMGAPGPIHYPSGIILNAVNLGWKDNFPLQKLLLEETLLPAIIENDANCAALGEMWKGAGTAQRTLSV